MPAVARMRRCVRGGICVDDFRQTVLAPAQFSDGTAYTNRTIAVARVAEYGKSGISPTDILPPRRSVRPVRQTGLFGSWRFFLLIVG